MSICLAQFILYIEEWLCHPPFEVIVFPSYSHQGFKYSARTVTANFSNTLYFSSYLVGILLGIDDLTGNG